MAWVESKKFYTGVENRATSLDFNCSVTTVPIICLFFTTSHCLVSHKCVFSSFVLFHNIIVIVHSVTYTYQTRRQNYEVGNSWPTLQKLGSPAHQKYRVAKKRMVTLHIETWGSLTQRMKKYTFTQPYAKGPSFLGRNYRDKSNGQILCPLEQFHFFLFVRNFWKKLAILITKVSRHSENHQMTSQYWARKQQWFSAVDWAWGWAQIKKKRKTNNGVKICEIHLSS